MNLDEMRCRCRCSEGALYVRAHETTKGLTRPGPSLGAKVASAHKQIALEVDALVGKFQECIRPSDRGNFQK